jgi:hypothetical protein
MNQLQPQLRINSPSSPAKRERKGAREAKRSGIGEGLQIPPPALVFPHRSHCNSNGPHSSPARAGEDIFGALLC